MGKNLSNKYSQRLLDSAKTSTTDAIETASKKAIEKAAEVTEVSVSKKSSKKSPSEEFHSQNEDEIETPKERYISSKTTN